ncbi:aspartate dehydrogenase domain-containing protein [Microbacterium sp. NC79]|uniref:aspartate dehydrogenase domain-containing protein n=1 Tax=Microbacterium sp. NC79 TaxID=2851009 RepID=UPI001C2C8078|nr:aspartate dehydrogenase domain-containing protein [Microbacterium sp. NC79]MBV0894766.1 DUF108 domain-containing protein [Microbacterium sp. NC79]
MAFRIVILGNGNLARHLADDPTLDIVGVIGRGDELPPVADYDLLVEVAAPDAVVERVVPAVEAGATALIVSVGALADADIRDRIRRAAGRAVVTSGAVGGLDFVRALALSGRVGAAHIASSKLPGTLIQPWMGAELVARLRRGDERIVLASGTAEHVASLFPRSANVAVAVALSADAWERTTAEMIADPAATNTTHVITATGTAGSITCEVSNLPSPAQPRSSMVVASAIMRSIAAIAALRGDTTRPVRDLLSII